MDRHKIHLAAAPHSEPGGPVAGTSLEHRSGAGEHDDSHGAEVAQAQPGQWSPTTPTRPARSGAGTAPGANSRRVARGSCCGWVWSGLLLLTHGNQESKVEDWWLVAIAGLMAIWLIAGEVKIRKDRARRP